MTTVLRFGLEGLDLFTLLLWSMCEDLPLLRHRDATARHAASSALIDKHKQILTELLPGRRGFQNFL